MSEMMDTLLMEYVDKLDDALENYSDDELDDFVSEMYEVYLEATQRRKKADEIDEWIDKQTVSVLQDLLEWNKNKLKDYEDEPWSREYKDIEYQIHAIKTNMKNGFGKELTPKKKRQLRNFLLQHKFDPTTETIVSDHKDGRRIKFNFGRRVGQNGTYHMERVRPNDDYIEIDKDNFKNIKNTNQTLSHEKGHHVLRRTNMHKDKKHPLSKSDYWNFSEYPEDKDERGIKHLDEAKAAGKKVNDHDDGTYLTREDSWEIEKQSPEELEADLHSAKTARVRTKYAGRKRAVKRSGATRNVNDKEILRHFQNMANSISDDRIPQLLDDIKLMDDKASGDALIEICDTIINAQKSSKITSGFSQSFANRYRNYIKAHANNLDTIKESLKQIKSLRNNINGAYTELDVNGVFGGYSIHSGNERQEIIKDVRRDIDKYMKELGDVQKYFESESKTINTLIKYRMHSFDIHKMELSDAKRFASNIKDLIKKDPNANIGYLEKMKKEIIANQNKLKSEFKKLGKLADESTGVRHDFVKKYVHEFFEDYYAYEDMEYFMEGFDEMESTAIATTNDDALMQKVATLFDKMHQNQRLQQLAESNGIDVKNSVKLTDDTMMNVAVTLVALSLAKEANDPRYKKLVNTGLQKRSLKMEIINDYKSKANEIINTYKNGI